MPLLAIIEHPAFFGTVLGAVTGWAGSWAAMRLTIRQLQIDGRELKDRVRVLEERHPISHDECCKSQERCINRVCVEIAALKKMLSDAFEKHEEIGNSLCKLSGVVETWIRVKSKEHSREPL